VKPNLDSQRFGFGAWSWEKKTTKSHEDYFSRQFKQPEIVNSTQFTDLMG